MNIYEDQNIDPISLFHKTNKELKEWMFWDTEVIEKELHSRGFNISRSNLNKLMAVKTFFISDIPWQKWEVFQNIVLALNGYPPAIDIMQIPQLHELWYGIEIINLIRVERFNDLDSDIPRYVAAILLHENIHYTPSPLDFAQIYISNPTYICKCGTKGNALNCFKWSCRECGNEDIKIDLEYDPTIQQHLYEQHLKEETPEIKEEADDIAAGKLLLAYNYVQLKLKEIENNLKRI